MINQNPYMSRGSSVQIRPSQAQNLNHNFQSYKILRGRILDKVQEVIVTLDNPNSSINRFLRELSIRYGSQQTQKFSKVIDKLYYNADQILANDTVDSFEYLEHMKQFTKYIKDLSREMLPYITVSDAVDELNPMEANDNLMRISNDFSLLEKSESNFPQNFRQTYVQEQQKR